MNTPPFLLPAALLFWGWQTGFLVVSGLMACALETARLLKARWEFSEEDFNRVWMFCSMLFLGATVYAFSANKGPADLLGFFENPNFFTQRNAGNASARTAASLIRWQPFIFLPFILAQVVSTRQSVPLRSISLLLRRRWKKAEQLGLRAEADASFNFAYVYFILCLFGASVHANEHSGFFWGICGLLIWALWPLRSPRFNLVAWTVALGLALLLGYGGQYGIGQIRRWVEGYSPAWLSRSVGGGADPTRSKTALGSIGRLKGSSQIAIRLEPKSGGPPTLLREASYRSYRGTVWYAGPKSDIPEMITAATTNQNTFFLLPAKTNAGNCVNIACYLRQGGGSLRRGLLPVPEGSARLDDLAVYTLQKNNLGDLLAEGPGLLIFDAHYGPGVTIDASPELDDDLSIPSREEAAIAQVAANLQLADQTPEQALRTIGGFFRAGFTYRPWRTRDELTSTNETPLSRFLLRRHYGHCEYFATASVLLARYARIPARYAVGYAVHEAAGNKYVVRQHDAHAWALVWNEQKGVWQDFDTTPASWVEAESQKTPLQALSDAWSGLMFQFSKFRWGQTHLRQYFLWALAPVLLLLFSQILWRIFRQRRHRPGTPGSARHDWPGLDSEFYALERELGKRGIRRAPGESLSEWLLRALNTPALAELQATAHPLLTLHYRYRFDPRGLDETQRALLRRTAAECLEYLGPARRELAPQARSPHGVP